MLIPWPTVSTTVVHCTCNDVSSSYIQTNSTWLDDYFWEQRQYCISNFAEHKLYCGNKSRPSGNYVHLFLISSSQVWCKHILIWILKKYVIHRTGNTVNVHTVALLLYSPRSFEIKLKSPFQNFVPSSHFSSYLKHWKSRLLSLFSW